MDHSNLFSVKSAALYTIHSFLQLLIIRAFKQQASLKVMCVYKVYSPHLHEQVVACI